MRYAFPPYGLCHQNLLTLAPSPIGGEGRY